LTAPLNIEPAETICLLDSILDSLCEANEERRKQSAALLAEFLKWSIKQTRPEEMRKKVYNLLFLHRMFIY